MWSKRLFMKNIEKLEKIANLKIEIILSTIEALDQDKEYIITIPGATQKEIDDFKEAFDIATKRMKWTTPTILFINKEIKEKV